MSESMHEHALNHDTDLHMMQTLAPLAPAEVQDDQLSAQLIHTSLQGMQLTVHAACTHHMLMTRPANEAEQPG